MGGGISVDLSFSLLMLLPNCTRSNLERPEPGDRWNFKACFFLFLPPPALCYSSLPANVVSSFLFTLSILGPSHPLLALQHRPCTPSTCWKGLCCGVSLLREVECGVRQLPLWAEDAWWPEFLRGLTWRAPAFSFSYLLSSLLYSAFGPAGVTLRAGPTQGRTIEVRSSSYPFS